MYKIFMFLLVVTLLFCFEDTGQLNIMIPYDSSCIKAWASGYTECVRGRIDIDDIDSDIAAFGSPDSIVGKIESGNSSDAVSLGDSGYIVCTFGVAVADKEGPDFAVFENAFLVSSESSNVFAELAFVEVSSNGENFVRIPSICRNSEEVNSYGYINPNDYYNFCSLAEGGNTDLPKGTGIDLSDAEYEPLVVNGTVDLESITHIRIIDVIGSGVTTDYFGNPVYDPYPTRFGSGGCDFRGIAVINTNEIPFIEQKIALFVRNNEANLFPNPVFKESFINLNTNGNNVSNIKIYDVLGRDVNFEIFGNSHVFKIRTKNTSTGMYFIKYMQDDKNKTLKININ